MKTEKTNFKFTIMMSGKRIVAKIYNYVPDNFGGKDIYLGKKTFGSMFRSLNENDYKKAREWVDLQMKCMVNANS